MSHKQPSLQLWQCCPHEAYTSPSSANLLPCHAGVYPAHLDIKGYNAFGIYDGMNCWMRNVSPCPLLCPRTQLLGWPTSWLRCKQQARARVALPAAPVRPAPLLLRPWCCRRHPCEAQWAAQNVLVPRWHELASAFRMNLQEDCVASPPEEPSGHATARLSDLTLVYSPCS